MSDTADSETSEFEPAPEFSNAAHVFAGGGAAARPALPTLEPIVAVPRGTTEPAQPTTTKPATPAKASSKKTKTAASGSTRINFQLHPSLNASWNQEADAMDLYLTDYIRAAIAIHSAQLVPPPEEPLSFARRQRRTDTLMTRGVRLPASELSELDAAVKRTRQNRSWVLREVLKLATACLLYTSPSPRD